MSGLRGRNDLLDIKNLGVNAIRSYEYKGYYNHAPFLNYAQTLGLKVLIISVHSCVRATAGSDLCKRRAGHRPALKR